MKKSSLLLFLFIFSGLVFPEAQVTENIEVDWWIVPVFALGQDENPVIDLKQDDIELLINNRAVTDFVIYKRDFNVSEVKPEESGELKIPEKKKIAFLIFDISFTALENLERSISIAKDLIRNGSATTSWVVMKVDPYAGLQYKGGPESDKDLLFSIIEKEIVINERGRSVEPIDTILDSTQIIGNKASKYEGEEMRFYSEEVTSSLRNANNNFYFSFESLYYALNQITENKFIYFFSEGLSFWSRKSTRHSEEQYFRRLKRAADLMGRSGSVIFVVNPMGYETGDINAMTGSGLSFAQGGEDSLKYIASESGGKYLRGNKKDLSEKLGKMNRSYYEVAFSDSDMPDAERARIEIRPRRKGLRIHSMRMLEKRKNYSAMAPIERELLVLNLLERNVLFRPPVEVRGFEVIECTKVRDMTEVKVRLPGEYRREFVDSYIVTAEKGEIDSDSVKTGIKPAQQGNLVNITVPGDYPGQSKLVFIDKTNNVAFVEGVIDAGEKFRKVLVHLDKKFTERLSRSEPASQKELKNILIGAGNYCSKLENAAFHFICKEDVHEILMEFSRDYPKKKETYNPQTGVMIRTRDPGIPPARSRMRKVTHRYLYDYQLLQGEGKVTEQRKLLKGKKRGVENGPINAESFISKRIVLTPVSILGFANRGNYRFRFVKNDRIDGVEAALIEVFPKNLDQIGSIYGNIWIDKADFSVIRIEVNPVSIGGFDVLLKLSSELGSILDVKCAIDFDLKREGIRFPTRVRIRELYHGGDFLKRVMNINTWEKSRTTYTYDGYKFFNVDTEVKIIE